MSASASKKKRKELEQQGLSPKDVAAKEAHKQKNKTLRNVLVVVLAVLVCIAAVFAVVKLVNRPSYDTEAALVTVGGETVSVPVYNYLYYYTAQNFCNSYSYFIQTGIPFADQNNIFGEGTLEDYFIQTTNTSLKEVLNVTARAKADHFELSEQDKTTIANSVNGVKSDAALYGYPSADKYLQVHFGEGCDLENYEEYLTLVMLYSAYAQNLSDEYKPTAEKLQAAYQEDPSAYDLVSFTYSTVSTQSSPVESTDENDSTDPTASAVQPTTYTDEAKAEARKKAEAYLKEMPEDAFTRTYSKSTAADYFTEEIVTWLFDETRKAGDVKVFARDESETAFYAMRFDGRETNDYHLANANIFTITKDQPKEDQEETPADQKDAALHGENGEENATGEQQEEKTSEQKREELLAAIRDGMTDEEFSKAVSDLGYSASTDSITKTYSIEEIRNFLFDSSRQPGDLYTAYETDSAYYIVRFVSFEEKTYRDQLVESALWSKYYTDLSTANDLTYDADLMRHANTNRIYNANTQS